MKFAGSVVQRVVGGKSSLYSCMGCVGTYSRKAVYSRLTTGYPKSSMTMTLVPITNGQFSRIAPKQVTPDQWVSYWGINKIERLQRILESVLVAYGGAWLSWFFSFMVGSVVSAFVGTGLIFNWMFTPWLNANRNNHRLREQKGVALHHAVYTGRIITMSKIRRRSGKTVGAMSQDYLDLVVRDGEDRVLEIVTPWQDDYRRLRKGMSMELLVASTSSDFQVVSALSEGYVPACGVWVGDYPYLQKQRFKRLVERQQRHGNESKPTQSGRIGVDSESGTDYEYASSSSRRRSTGATSSGTGGMSRVSGPGTTTVLSPPQSSSRGSARSTSNDKSKSGREARVSVSANSSKQEMAGGRGRGWIEEEQGVTLSDIVLEENELLMEVPIVPSRRGTSSSSSSSDNKAVPVIDGGASQRNAIPPPPPTSSLSGEEGREEGDTGRQQREEEVEEEKEEGGR